MKFNKIGEIVLPNGKFDYYGTVKDIIDEVETWHDRVNALQDKSDLLQITLRNGKTFLAAETNMLLGLCDDCTEANYDRNVAKVEGFKKEV